MELVDFGGLWQSLSKKGTLTAAGFCFFFLRRQRVCMNKTCPDRHSKKVLHSEAQGDALISSFFFNHTPNSVIS